MLDLLAATGTRTGLKVDPQLDERTYPNKIRVSEDPLAAVRDRPPPCRRMELRHQTAHLSATGPNRRAALGE